MLYPRDSETRESKSLDGIWIFRCDFTNEGIDKKWYLSPLEHTIPMAVPSSYNDLTQDKKIKDHIGFVWYETDFFFPKSWSEGSFFVRFGSVTHKAIVWLDGKEIGTFKGGYLPFAFDISKLVKPGQHCRLTVAVDNSLDWQTLPPGEIKMYKGQSLYPEGYKIQEYFHDFYNYAGIHRSVKILKYPLHFIKDISVNTSFSKETGSVEYSIDSTDNNLSVSVELYSQDWKKIEAESKGKSGHLTIKNVILWQPLKPYLYNLKVMLFDNLSKLIDSYTLPIGIRTVKVNGSEFLINDKPFYFKGFGKHEDSSLRGKGFDNVVNIKDFSLLKWIGANSFRTSHYPYSEEIMNLADQEGIVVVDESPAVGMNPFNSATNFFTTEKINESTLNYHKEVLTDLYHRDKNHPCVVMWSVANEPSSYEPGSENYFKEIATTMRVLDSTRPITVVECTSFDKTVIASFFDVVCVNRYFGWYTDSGCLDIIEQQLEWELTGWHERFNKPVLVTEYGADTIAGFHKDPPEMFTEEFQCEFLKAYHRAFDKLKFVVGEHVWAFADFATKQGVKRVLGNRKGIFTREREPKSAAFVLRERWNSIANENYK